jgi:outer membrane protein assembly factor BamB
MWNKRLAGVLAAIVVGTQFLPAQEASQRSEELARAMARIGVERAFSVYALDYGCMLYGGWIAGHDLYLEQFGRSGRYEIVALDLRTGERKWVVQTGPNRLKAAPNPGDRHVAFLTENDGGMIVVNRATGVREFRMRADINTPTTFPAACSDTTVFVSSLASSQIVALNPIDGRPGWRYPLGSLLTTGPVITPRLTRKLVVAGCLDGTVTALPAQGWNEAPPTAAGWKRRIFGAVNALTVAEGTDQGRRVVSILASCEDGGLYCLDSASGEPRWVARNEMPVKEPAMASGGSVFARAGKLVAVDLVTGQPKWKGGSDKAGPAAWERATAGFACDAKRAYLRGDVKEIWRADAKTGEILASTRLVEFDYVLAAPEANMIVGLTSDGYVTASR